MEPDNIQQQPRSSFYRRGRYWLLGIALLLLTLAGCLTSHAAGVPNKQDVTTATTLPPPMASATLATAAINTPAITLVPNMAIRAFQETPTATATLTPTIIPETATPTLEPTFTLAPTNTPTSQPPTDTPTPQPTNTPVPTRIETTPSPFAAYAWVDNYYPAPGSVVTVHGQLFRSGRPVNGAHMGVTWRYTHGKAFCSAYSGIDGKAACALNIGAPLQNYWVYLDVVFVYEDQVYYAKTGFVTDP